MMKLSTHSVGAALGSFIFHKKNNPAITTYHQLHFLFVCPPSSKKTLTQSHVQTKACKHHTGSG